MAEAQVSNSGQGQTKAPPPVASGVRDAAPAQSRNKVIVGCNLPHGLVIRLYAPQTGEDGTIVMQPASEEVKLNGANSSNIIGGCGLTEVDADFWEAWLKQNPKFKPLTTGNIWSQPDQGRAAGAAMEHGTILTGAERLDPDKPRIKGIAKATKDS